MAKTGICKERPLQRISVTFQVAISYRVHGTSSRYGTIRRPEGGGKRKWGYSQWREVGT